MITDPIFWAIALPAMIVLGLAKGGFAGLGSIATPLVALYMPPLEAAALILPILLVQDVISVWAYRKDWSVWNLKVLVPGALLGIGLAWAFAGVVSNDVIRIAVGLIGVSFVVNAFVRRGNIEPQQKTAASGVFWGGVSGFVSTLTQGGAPPFQVHMLPQRLPKMTLVGTTTIFFAIVNALKVIPYFALGQFNARNLTVSVVLLPLAILANVLGIWLVRRVPMEAFYNVAYVLALIISSSLIYQGVSNLTSS